MEGEGGGGGHCDLEDGNFSYCNYFAGGAVFLFVPAG